jgi:hypothetical protein
MECCIMRIVEITVQKIALFTPLLGICLAAEPGRIEGRLNGGREDLRGVTVWAMTNDCRRAYRTVTDTGSRFTFVGIPPGTYQMIASIPGFSTSPIRGIEVQSDRTTPVEASMQSLFSPEGGERLTYPLPSVVPLIGVVVDPSHRPVEGALIVQVDQWGYEDNVRPTSDADGRFGFCSLQTGKMTLLVTHAAYRPQKVRLTLGFASRTSDGTVEIKLRPK